MLKFKFLLEHNYWSGGHDFNNSESSLYIQLIFDVNNDISCAVILEKFIFKTHISYFHCFVIISLLKWVFSFIVQFRIPFLYI